MHDPTGVRQRLFRRLCSGPGASHTPSVPLGNGKYVFSVRAKDKAGNIDPTPASRAFTVSSP